MWASALYYPYMRVRDTDWLKVAALYWDSMHRFQPHGYDLRDTADGRAFAEAGFLRQLDPSPYARDVALELLGFMRANRQALQRRFSVHNLEPSPAIGRRWGFEGPGWGDSHLGWIHGSKMSYSFAGALADSGLAHIGRGHDAQWVGVHPTLAAAYMLALTSACAAHDQLEPVTDEPVSHLSPASGVESAMRLLSDDAELASYREYGVDTTAGFAMLAIESVVPRDLGAISVERILAIRDKLTEELGTFREFVASQQQELERLASIRADSVRTEALATHLDKEIKRRVERLDRGLRSLGYDTARSLLTTQTVTPPVLAVAGANLADAPPAVATVGAVGLLVGTAWWQLVKNREQQLRASPTGYLLAVKRALKARTVTDRMAKLLRKA
ncbi:hypothetical protein Prum_036260 [Phytohabitans rumicis]|uniref:Uncharacterized protein n=2 Tax=Phytohabitans rumicis TaxID=1076125 RepID=A0A6V8L1I3_9ACTN|nr:hypothetical protein Prum_036260 [Phytohabitans rumicis]